MKCFVKFVVDCLCETSFFSEYRGMMHFFSVTEYPLTTMLCLFAFAFVYDVLSVNIKAVTVFFEAFFPFLFKKRVMV